MNDKTPSTKFKFHLITLLAVTVSTAAMLPVLIPVVRDAVAVLMMPGSRMPYAEDHEAIIIAAIFCAIAIRILIGIYSTFEDEKPKE